MLIKKTKKQLQWLSAVSGYLLSDCWGQGVLHVWCYVAVHMDVKDYTINMFYACLFWWLVIVKQKKKKHWLSTCNPNHFKWCHRNVQDVSDAAGGCQTHHSPESINTHPSWWTINHIRHIYVLSIIKIKDWAVVHIVNGLMSGAADIFCST